MPAAQGIAYQACHSFECSSHTGASSASWLKMLTGHSMSCRSASMNSQPMSRHSARRAGRERRKATPTANPSTLHCFCEIRELDLSPSLQHGAATLVSAACSPRCGRAAAMLGARESGHSRRHGIIAGAGGRRLLAAGCQAAGRRQRVEGRIFPPTGDGGMPQQPGGTRRWQSLHEEGAPRPHLNPARRPPHRTALRWHNISSAPPLCNTGV